MDTDFLAVDLWVIAPLLELLMLDFYNLDFHPAQAE